MPIQERRASRYAALPLLLAVFTARAPAALNINTEVVQSSVVFLYGPDDAGKADPQKEVGTGFLVRVPLTSDAKKSFILLVTARHIVDPQWAKCTEPNPSLVYARMNKSGHTTGASGQGTVFVPLLLVHGAQPLWKHPSEDMADAAVMVVQSPDTALQEADAGTIPISDFPTDDEMKGIGVGDQILSAGLVPGFSGGNRNRPFFKFGFISSTSSEDIEVRCAPATAPYNIRGWFLAANLVPGNSGSPVFFVPPGGGGRRVRLACTPPRVARNPVVQPPPS